MFTDAPLEGNQLAVFPDGRGAAPSSDAAARARAEPLRDGLRAGAPRREATLRIRIFTPAAELPFAGHPVLGSAIVAGAALRREAVTLETAAGRGARER